MQRKKNHSIAESVARYFTIHMYGRGMSKVTPAQNLTVAPSVARLSLRNGIWWTMWEPTQMRNHFPVHYVTKDLQTNEIWHNMDSHTATSKSTVAWNAMKSSVVPSVWTGMTGVVTNSFFSIYFLWEIINFPGGQINDPSGRVFFSSVALSNSLLSDTWRAFWADTAQRNNLYAMPGAEVTGQLKTNNANLVCVFSKSLLFIYTSIHDCKKPIE